MPKFVDESMSDGIELSVSSPQVWSVGALCRAVADALNARFNPVAVQGEISGFTRATSGHCYFTLKDAQGQMRCAMFKRVAQMQDFLPREGELVQVFGKLGVYEPRGELQLIVEGLRRAGQGALFEQFIRLKAKLQEQGLFAEDRKRAITPRPRKIGVVTSLGAAALKDVVTTLQRRVSHIPVIISPASVQGGDAPIELGNALQSLACQPEVDVILLVRGGGSMEDLWAFNDEKLAHAIVSSPVPVICGVGHETDFTIADFCADLRAPTPTAAAELCAKAQIELLDELDDVTMRLQQTVWSFIDQQNQRLDRAQQRLGRPSEGLGHEKIRLLRQQQRMLTVINQRLQTGHNLHQRLREQFIRGVQFVPQKAQDALHRAELRLKLLDPKLVLQRGYAWLADNTGHALTATTQLESGQHIQATLVDGRVDLEVLKTYKD
jgi:exodeoxyribonuclease VII large subunit